MEKESDKKLPQIRVGGVVYEPYFYKDIDGEFTGIDVELAKEAFRRMGYEPVFVDVDIAKVDSALSEDIVDCLWSCYSMNESIKRIKIILWIYKIVPFIYNFIIFYFNYA